ncbi:hypothetical protein GBF38_004963 [Nibea albiflora]|uniref:Uncharacterized protein n=1 Tax=Nibea albiflora TaxID=240163 RepID=A0ACB7EVI7_NIBAL|nr:hypothetical protein GBF38_004963 [Nibea albiflora]
MPVNSTLLFYKCSDSTVGLFIFTSYSVIRTLLLLPLSIFVFYLGQRRWRQQRSFSTTSHSDIFTYHMAAVNLFCILGNIIFFCGMYTALSDMIVVGFYMYSIVFPGEMLFHILTCVDRYLAVVHPVTYRGLRQSRGVRIRNISIACVWLLCFGWCGIIALYFPDLPNVPYLLSLLFSSAVVSFMSLRVLCVLIRPGPGEAGRDSVDQSKQRAFNTIIAVTAVQWLWLIGAFICVVLYYSDVLSYSAGCILISSVDWFTLPSILVLPVLFVHRAGKLTYRHSNNK